MGFSRQEYWNGLPFPYPGDLPNPGIQPDFLHCRQILYRLCHQGRPLCHIISLHICCRSLTQSCLTLCSPMDCSTPGLPVHHQLPEFTQTHVHRVSDAIQPSHPLLSPLHMRWPKYWSFSFSIIPSKEITWLISFRMDWLDLLAVQGTLKSLLQHHSSKASILLRSAFFTVQLSHRYMTTE